MTISNGAVGRDKLFLLTDICAHSASNHYQYYIKNVKIPKHIKCLGIKIPPPV